MAAAVAGPLVRQFQLSKALRTSTSCWCSKFKVVGRALGTYHVQAIVAMLENIYRSVMLTLTQCNVLTLL
jgi:hypothetical protein